MQRRWRLAGPTGVRPRGWWQVALLVRFALLVQSVSAERGRSSARRTPTRSTGAAARAGDPLGGAAAWPASFACPKWINDGQAGSAVTADVGARTEPVRIVASVGGALASVAHRLGVGVGPPRVVITVAPR